MVERTENHELHVYDRGDTDWTHAPDMRTIERRLVVRDVVDARDSYEPHEGATFVATDTGAVYDGTGEEWQKASREFATVVADDLHTRAPSVVNAREHGARGDGSSDDTDAIRDAIEAAGSGIVTVPRGTYTITEELRIGSATLRGDGMAATTIELDGEVGRAVTVDVEGGGVTACSIACRGQTTEGVRLAAPHTAAHCVAVDHVDQPGDETDSTACINVMSAPHATVSHCRATRARAPNTGISNGIHVGGTGGDVSVIGCRVDDVTPRDDGDGIVVHDVNPRSRVIGNCVTAAAKSALKIGRRQRESISVLATGNSLQADPGCLCVARIQGTETTFAGNTIVQDRVRDAVIRVATSPSHDSAPVTLSGNIVELTDPAGGNDLIRVRDWDHTVVIGDNALAMAGGGRWAIRVDGAETVVIDGNAIDAPGRTGIELAGTTGASITGNVVEGAGRQGIAVASDAARCVVTGNVVDAPDGIVVADGASDVAVGTNVGG